MKIKSLIIVLVMFILSLVLTTVVFAEPIITIPDNDFKLNDEFEMGIDAGEELKDVEFNLQYDKSAFQYVSSSSQNVDITDQNGTLIVKTQNASELKRYTVMLKFKVIDTSKKTANVILNVKGTNAAGSTLNLTGMRGLNLVGDVTLPTPNTQNTTTTPTPNTPTNTDKPATNEKMPNTGSFNYIIPSVIVIIAICAYIMYKKNKNLY